MPRLKWRSDCRQARLLSAPLAKVELSSGRPRDSKVTALVACLSLLASPRAAGLTVSLEIRLRDAETPRLELKSRTLTAESAQSRPLLRCQAHPKTREELNLLSGEIQTQFSLSSSRMGTRMRAEAAIPTAIRTPLLSLSSARPDSVDR